MNLIRWHWLSISLVGTGVVIVWASFFFATSAIATAGVLLGGILCLVSAGFFCRELSGTELTVEAKQQAVARKQAELDVASHEFEQLQSTLQAELEKQASEIVRKQQQLTSRLAVWHEWMEFPAPVDLAEQISAEESLAADAELAELAAKDGQLNQLLEEESKRLFDNVLENKYVVEGQFQPVILRDDAYALIQKVARIYRPDIENPLLDTSVEKLARAFSRACLHFLVVLETLPGKVQGYNIGSMFGWVKQGVKAYGVYKSARPYLPYVNSAYYMTRFAMGASPITLLTWWVVSEVTSRSASAVTTKIVQQKSLTLLQMVVRVVGYEVATVFGGDVRRRDVNWIYGVELTDLVSRFPLSRDSLERALAELGSLQLLNEYDRMFLFRSLAAQRSADPAQYSATVFLNSRERRAVASRLERFFARSIHGKTANRVADWRTDVEKRLAVKICIDATAAPTSQADQAVEALRSLASFLVSIKEQSPSELHKWMADTSTSQLLPAESLNLLLDKLAENPPYFFEEPNLDLHGPVTAAFLDDLASLAVHCPPHDFPVEAFVVDTAYYLGFDQKAAKALLERHWVATLQDRLVPSAAAFKKSQRLARAVLWHLAPDEQVAFVYPDAQRQAASSEDDPAAPLGKSWLVGTEDRLFVVADAELPELIWQGDSSVQVIADAGRLTVGCLVHGGSWLIPPDNDDALQVRGATLQGFKTFFAPLLRYADDPPTSK